MGFADMAKNYPLRRLEKGLLKIMSKMGISVLNSYQGAQIFEAVGIGEALIAIVLHRHALARRRDRLQRGRSRETRLARHSEAFGNAVPDGECD